jgi:hypothetical protein
MNAIVKFRDDFVNREVEFSSDIHKRSANSRYVEKFLFSVHKMGLLAQKYIVE